MNYSHIYTNINDDKITQDIKKCLKHIHKLNLLSIDKTNVEITMATYIEHTNQYLLYYNKLLAYTQLLIYSNFSNSSIANLQKKLLKINLLFTKSVSKFAINCSKIKELQILINASTQLQPYKKHLLSLCKPHFWETKTSKNTSYEAFYNFLLSDSNSTYSDIENDVCECLINIKKSAFSSAQNYNFDSVLDLELYKNNLNSTVLSNIINNITKCRKPFEKYILSILKEKNNSAIPYSELFRPTFSKLYTKDFIDKFVIKAFYNHSKELGELASDILTNHTLSLNSNSKFNSCHIKLFFSKNSEIVIKRNNTLSDLFSIAHELGHAYQSKILMNNNTPINCLLTPAFEELGAMYCENLIIRYTLNHITDPILCKNILSTYISHLFEATLDIYVRYLFEKNIFDNINDTYTAEILYSLMENLQREIYINYIIPNKNLWLEKSHFYSTTTSFYNFPYSFALFLSLSLPDSCLTKIFEESGKIDYQLLNSKFNINIEDNNSFNLAIEKINFYVEKFISM